MNVHTYNLIIDGIYSALGVQSYMNNTCPKQPSSSSVKRWLGFLKEVVENPTATSFFPLSVPVYRAVSFISLSVLSVKCYSPPRS